MSSELMSPLINFSRTSENFTMNVRFGFKTGEDVSHFPLTFSGDIALFTIIQNLVDIEVQHRCKTKTS